MLRVVLGELCHGEQAGPVGLLEVAVHPQILLQHRVHPLRLAIRLGVEGGRAVGTNPQEFQKSAPKVLCEHRIAITDQRIWQAMKPDDLVDEQGSHVRRRHGFCRGDKNRLFGKSVDHHENCVVVVARWQVRNPI